MEMKMIISKIIVTSVLISGISGINSGDEEKSVELKNETTELDEGMFANREFKKERLEIPHIKEEMWETTEENDGDDIEIPSNSSPTDKIRVMERLVEIRNDDYYCVFCKVRFRFARHYEEHFSKRHQKKKAFRCPICPYGSGLRQLLLKHVYKYHSGQVNVILSYEKRRTFWCASCDLHFEGAKVFDNHALTVHKGVKMMECSQCEVKYFRQNALVAHTRLKHSGRKDGNNFKCKLCKNVFYRSDKLKQHGIKCRERQAKKIGAGPVRTELTLLEGIEFQNTCRACGEKFQYSTHLKAHLEERHPEAVKTTFPCVYCNKTFARILVLDKHLDKYHAEIDENPPLWRWRKGRAYKCEHCSSEFRTLNPYETHVKKEHPGEKSFRCAVCGLGFNLKQTLTRHLKSMHGRPELSCEYCGISFALVSELHAHEKRCRKKDPTAGKRREFFCDICQRTRRGASERHKRNHDDFDHCPFCDKRFHRLNNRRGLRHHLGRRHSNEIRKAASSPQSGHIADSGGEEGVKVEWPEEVDLEDEEDGIKVELEDDGVHMEELKNEYYGMEESRGDGKSIKEEFR